MRILAFLVWGVALVGGIILQPVSEWITAISIITMLLCVVMVLADILDALRAEKPAPSRGGNVGMFASTGKRAEAIEGESEVTAMYYGRKRSES